MTTRSRTSKQAWPTVAIAALIGWSAWLWVTHLDTMPIWLIFIAGYAGGAFTMLSIRVWARLAAKRLGIKVTRTRGTQRGRR